MTVARSKAGSPEPTDGFRLPRSGRIRRASMIRSLFRLGKMKKTLHLDVFFLPSPASRSRLGVVVSKYQHSIVERNRIKRRLREIGRTKVLPALSEHGRAFDVLIRARRGAYSVGFHKLRKELEALTEMLCSGE